MSLRTTHRTLGSAGSRGFLAALLAALAIALAFIAAPASWAPVSSAQDAYPLTLVDDEGTEVTLDAVPERIISLSPATTETVFGLGAGDRLVGGTDFDDFPASAADLPDVASFSGVIMERVVELEPDLVIAAGNGFTAPEAVARMRELGYPVIVLYAPDVSAVLADIDLIGAAIGTPTEAQAMTTRMSRQLDAISEAARASGVPPRTYVELDWFDGSTYGPAPESFVADMVELAGGVAITTGDPAVFAMSLERLLVEDPEVIVLADAMFGVCPAAVVSRPGWGEMTAIVGDDVRPLDGLTVTRPGPRLPQGLASLALAIDPELELDLDTLGLEVVQPPCSAG